MTSAGDGDVVVAELGSAPDDEPRAAAASLLAAAVDAPFGDATVWHESVTSRHRVVLVATRGAAVVGTALGQVAGDTADVLTVAVAPASRRLGVGRALTRALRDALVARGAATVLLEVRRDNHAARRLYEGLGFVPTSVRRRYYGDGQDALVLVWTA